MEVYLRQPCIRLERARHSLEIEFGEEDGGVPMRLLSDRRLQQRYDLLDDVRNVSCVRIWRERVGTHSIPSIKVHLYRVPRP